MVVNIAAPLASSESDVGAQEALNNGCFCLTLDDGALTRALDSELAGVQLSKLVRERCPYVFAVRPVFVDTAHIQRMSEVIHAVESVVALPAFREQVLVPSPEFC